MKIIKKGKKQSSEIRFTCKWCGCEFLASKGEYEYSFDQRDNVSSYSCHCPECNNPCIEIK